MPSNFPTSLDTLSNPASTDQLSNVTTPHASQHANANDILEAVEAKLGLGASTPPASAAVLRRTGTGSSGWAQVAAGDYAAGSIVNADVNGSAAIAYSKLNLGTSIVNADVSTSAAIAYSKLNLSNSIVTGDIVDGTVTTTDLAANAATLRSNVNVGTGATVGFGGGLADIAGGFIDLAITGPGDVLVIATASMSNSTSGTYGYLAVTYDAFAASTENPTYFAVANTQLVLAMCASFSGVATGTRRFKAQWRGAVAGTVSLFGLQMWALELRR